MKLFKISGLAAVLTMAFAGYANAATVTVSGGTVHFVGQIVAAGCSVDSESMNQTVEMGQVRTSAFGAKGDKSDAKDFNITLNNCDTTIAKNAAFSFLGQTSTASDILALSGNTDGSAKNIGINIVDQSGANFKVDGSTFGAKTSLVDGKNVIPLTARYISTGDTVVAGQANAVATFNVQYD
ncbi:type 1 fimbrial major subunit FimA [Proteus myxofaciens]|uniref:Type 1 fimbriae major subunit n=1 Tax=Proteus myxofaciens ATCC 19692 TaxID=1354337 RepID=A0A198GCW3_9GAMM|nr:type 1 fimbrial major subunit FimA [Proteus myxofaciens]OAT34750.1 type 1 fimbriae major subunit [Proteus myxofaciens ATCC 19692]